MRHESSRGSARKFEGVRACHKSAGTGGKAHETALASVDFASPIRIVALLRKGPAKVHPLPEALRRPPQPTANALQNGA